MRFAKGRRCDQQTCSQNEWDTQIDMTKVEREKGRARYDKGKAEWRRACLREYCLLRVAADTRLLGRRRGVQYASSYSVALLCCSSALPPQTFTRLFHLELSSRSSVSGLWPMLFLT